MIFTVFHVKKSASNARPACVECYDFCKLGQAWQSAQKTRITCFARGGAQTLSAKGAFQSDVALDMVNNKLCIWLVRFGRTASLQIAYVAGPHCAICA